MKFSGQTKDGAIDNLLRAYVSRPSNPQTICPDFDPDQANAYVERSLPGAVRLRYEAHLSGCAGCRKSVVALARMADADSLPVVTLAREVPQSTWLAGLRRMFGAVSQPQWAMAAVAVIVLGVSVPLFLSRSQTPEASQTVANQAAAEQPAGAASPIVPAATPRSGEAPASLVASSRARENADDKVVASAKDAPAPAPGEAAGFVAANEVAKKAEAKSGTETADETQRKADSQAAPAQAGAAPAAQVAREDAERSRQQQPERDGSQQVSELKALSRANEERAKEKTERAEDVALPPAPRASSDETRGRSGLRRPGKLALRDSANAEAVRPEERKFSGKKFLFRDGAWTDKDFDPNKDLPVVTIIRDSNVYMEVLNQRPGLKPFLTGFPAADRAIIVYKRTVYKLIPQ